MLSSRLAFRTATTTRVAPRWRLARTRFAASDDARGVAFMLASVAGYSVMGVCVKLVSGELPTMEVVFVRSTFMMVVTGAMVWRAGVSALGVARATLVVRAVVGAAALSLYYFSLGRLPLGDATTVFYTAPVWTALSAALFLGEPLRPVALGGAVLSLAGVVLVARPSFFGTLGGASLDPVGLAAVVAASVLSGLAYTLVRRLRTTDHPYTTVLYLSVVGTVGALPFAAGGTWVWPSNRAWMLLVGLGVGTQVAQITLTRGLYLLEAGRATAVSYVQVVVAFGWGVVLFGERPGALAVVGAVLIVVSALASVRR